MLPVSQPAPVATSGSSALPRWGRREALIVALLLGATVLTYSSLPACEFINYDDDKYVTENPYLQVGLSWRGLVWGLNTVYYSNWHPLVWWSFLLDERLYGLNAAGFHLTNLLWHSASVLMLFVALRRLTGAVWPSALVAALFALHPLNVQAVAWVSERKGVISTFFWMLTLWTYARYAEKPGPGRYALVALSLTLGLMAKQMLVTLPCVLLLLDYWPLRRWRPGEPLGRLALEKLPLLLIAALGGMLTVLAQGRSGAITSLEEISMEARVKNVLVSYVVYLERAVYPLELAAFYPHPGDALPWWQAGAAALFLAAVTALVLWQGRRRPYLAVGWFWYLGTLVPVIGLVQLALAAQADRYAYVPLVGIFVSAAWALAEFTGRFRCERAAAGLAGVILCCLGLLSWVQVQYWRNSLLLWENALRVTGGSGVAHNNLGLALRDDPAEKERSLEHFEAAVRFEPRNARYHTNLGLLLVERGSRAEAAAHFREAVRLEPTFADAQMSLGVLLYQDGEVAQARRHLEEACRLEPDKPLPQLNLGMAQLRQGEAAAAVEQFEQAARRQPVQTASFLWNLALGELHEGRAAAAVVCLGQVVALQPESSDVHREFADALEQAGRAAEAREEYQQALRLDPTWPQAVCRRAWNVATSPAAGRREAAQAVRLARQAVQATEGREPRALDVLAAAYASAGSFPEAAQSARRAAARATATGQAELAREIEARVRLYEVKRPYLQAAP